MILCNLLQLETEDEFTTAQISYPCECFLLLFFFCTIKLFFKYFLTTLNRIHSLMYHTKLWLMIDSDNLFYFFFSLWKCRTNAKRYEQSTSLALDTHKKTEWSQRCAMKKRKSQQRGERMRRRKRAKNKFRVELCCDVC